MSLVFKSMRHKVSADKNRYTEDDYDLDLTYITDRIVAMAFPADGVEATYRNNIDHVASLLKEKHNLDFILYNLANRPYDCTKFGGQVNNWCGFPDHHPPPLPLLFKIVHSIHQWLSSCERNIAVIHCLAGKGRTGVIISCYFVYCGLFTNIDHALNFFAYRRSLNHWGVTGPAQLRYVQYFSDIVHGKAIPHLSTMHLLRIAFSPIPRFAIGAGEKGCTPFFEIYQLRREKVLLFSSENTEGDIVPLDIRNRKAIFPVRCMIQGDILISFKHITPMHSTEPMFEFVFNVGMVHGATIVFEKGDLEKAEKDLRFPRNFQVELMMEPCTDEAMHLTPNQKEIQLNLFMKREPLYPEICFNGSSARVKTRIHVSRDLGDTTSGSYCVKGGYCYKRGHKVKNWKRRWFVIRSSTITYHKNPRDIKHLGEIPLASVKLIRYAKDEEMTFCFEIITSKCSFLISAPTQDICDSWVEALKYSMNLLKNMKVLLTPLGSVKAKLIEAKEFKYHGELCCTIALGDQVFVSQPKKKATENVILFDEEFSFAILDDRCCLDFALWENDWELDRETLLSNISIPLPVIRNTAPINDWYVLRSSNDSSSKVSNKFQLHIAFEYIGKPLADEMLRTESEMLYPGERRAARLGLSIECTSETQHASWSKYFRNSTSLNGSSRRALVSPHSIREQKTFASASPEVFKPAQSPSTKVSNQRSSSLIGVRTPVRQETSEDSEAETSVSAGMIRLFKADGMDIECIHFFNGILWTGDRAGALHLWNPKNGEKLQTIQAHSSIIYDLASTDNQVISCSSDNISIWSMEGELICQIPVELAIKKILVVPREDSHYLWTAGANGDDTRGEISVFCLATMKCKKRVNMSNSTVGCFFYDENKKIIWLGALDFVLGFDAMSCGCVAKTKIGLGMVSHLICNSSLLWMTCQESSDVIVFSSKNEQFVNALPTELSVGPVMNYGDFVWAAAGRALYVWDVESLECILQLESTHKGEIIDIVKLEDTLICTLSSDNSLGIWNFSHS